MSRAAIGIMINPLPLLAIGYIYTLQYVSIYCMYNIISLSLSLWVSVVVSEPRFKPPREPPRYVLHALTQEPGPSQTQNIHIYNVYIHIFVYTCIYNYIYIYNYISYIHAFRNNTIKFLYVLLGLLQEAALIGRNITVRK